MLTYMKEVALTAGEDLVNGFEKPTSKDWVGSLMVSILLAVFLWTWVLPEVEPKISEQGSMIVVVERQQGQVKDKDIVVGKDIATQQMISLLVSKDYPTKNGQREYVARSVGKYTKTKYEYLSTDYP